MRSRAKAKKPRAEKPSPKPSAQAPQTQAPRSPVKVGAQETSWTDAKWLALADQALSE